MAATTEIITSAEIIELSIPLKAGFEPRYFDKWILKGQRQWVKPFLGVDFYDEILDEIEGTLTSDNETLVTDYLKPMLAHYMLYERLPQISSHVTNAGVTSQTDEFSAPAPQISISGIRNQALSDAQHFEEQTREFIKEAQEDDSSKYPLFECGKKNSNKYGFIFY